MRWQGTSTIAPKPSSLAEVPRFDRSMIAHADLHAPLSMHEVKPWSCSVDVHFADLQEHLLNCLQVHCPRPRTAAKKPYLSPELWTSREQKIRCRKNLKINSKLLQRETLARVFSAWQQTLGKEDSVTLDMSLNFGTSLRCFAVHLTCQYHRFSKQLRTSIAKAKSLLLKHALDELPRNTPASCILQVLRAYTGPNQKLRQGMTPLPAIKDQHGDGARGPKTLSTDRLTISLDSKVAFASMSTRRERNGLKTCKSFQPPTCTSPLSICHRCVNLNFHFDK